MYQPPIRAADFLVGRCAVAEDFIVADGVVLLTAGVAGVAFDGVNPAVLDLVACAVFCAAFAACCVVLMVVFAVRSAVLTVFRAVFTVPLAVDFAVCLMVFPPRSTVLMVFLALGAERRTLSAALRRACFLGWSAAALSLIHISEPTRP